MLKVHWELVGCTGFSPEEGVEGNYVGALVVGTNEQVWMVEYLNTVQVEVD